MAVEELGHRFGQLRSIPTQIRQLIFRISNSKGHVDGFVGELTSAKRLEKHFV